MFHSVENTEAKNGFYCKNKAIVLQCTQITGEGGIGLALKVMRGIRYMDTVPDSPESHFSFVHEILRTKEEEQFRDPHTHGQYHKIIFFNSGTRDIKVGSRVENCGPGDILVLAHGEWYCGRSHDTFLDRYTLHVGVHALDCFGSFGKELMRQFTDRVLYTDNRFRLPKER